jgi:perosamine synthetase
VFDPISTSQPRPVPGDAQALAEALRTAVGHEARRLEETLASIAGRPFGVGVGSPGTAFEVAFRALGIGPGDEVLLPALGSVEAADAVARVHAMPVFADVDPRSLGLCPKSVEARIGERTRAIVATTLLGDAGGLETIANLAARHEVTLVEDASDALGASHGGRPIGKFGRVALLALTDDRPVAASGATVLATHDDVLAKRCRRFGAGVPDEDLDRAGVDSPLDDFRAAVGLNRLVRLSEALEARRRIADTYVRRLSGVSDLILPAPRGDGGGAWPRFVVRLSDRFSPFERDEVLEGMRRHEILATTGPVATPLLVRHGHRTGHTDGAFPVAERAAGRSIALPFHEGLSEPEIDLVCQTLDLMIKRTSFRRD